MPEITVRLSREAGDAANARKGIKPDFDRVAGQTMYVAVVCWNCWAVNEVDLDASRPFDYICWNCGIVGTI